jgi:hypothetical protein
METKKWFYCKRILILDFQSQRLLQHKQGSNASENGRVEWERKSDETRKKTERKEGNRDDIHRQRPYKIRR